ncbi:inositol-3-phosphate synthase [Rubrobacter indicoceani]|uniref:inositol-3-phosphate synthase n=1 Tax=Rubrobacter indicoceani TaxID=2051957 RepID=UPI001968B273|nr:inositol-3-phosphate synthase [Rubrobacter indicoceani]
MQESSGAGTETRRVGVAIVGVGGAVATTAIAGIAMIRKGIVDTDGLPLADLDVRGLDELAPYENLVFGGWDLSGDDLTDAAVSHGVMDKAQIYAVKDDLDAVKPWPAAGNPEFCRNVAGDNVVVANGHREQVDLIKRDLHAFREEHALDEVVLVNLASTERVVDLEAGVFASVEAFERGLDNSDSRIGPAMIYAYAAITSGVPYVNFTPSAAADIPALTELANRENIPVAGRDGKTGQTMIKTVLAPAFKARGLKVEGWFSTNILGNRDGLALDDADSLASKITTKGSVLDEMLGYEVEDHIVSIHYYKPRGDAKEAWDNVDLVGFMGRKMQIKVNFLCSDSILAAPLVIELVRLVDLAKRRGEGGVQEQLGLFFKAPMVENGNAPEHAFHEQGKLLADWISGA